MGAYEGISLAPEVKRKGNDIVALTESLDMANYIGRILEQEQNIWFDKTARTWIRTSFSRSHDVRRISA